MARTHLLLLLLFSGCRTVSKSDAQANPDVDALAADSDSDGFAEPDDCDDRDEMIHPGADEVCDGIDNDCDGEIDEGVLREWFADADADGFGDAGTVILACEPFDGVSSNGNDCNDNDAAVFPGAPEECNGVDDDCDSLVDDEDPDLDPSSVTAWYVDADLDGYGDPATASESCVGPSGTVADGTDCDDTDASVNPGVVEICNDVDDDCDGLVDDDDPGVDPTTARAWYTDGDLDGYGDASSVLYACVEPSGTVSDGTDCDDALASVHPGATEICDGLDNDCSGSVSWLEADDDGNGRFACEELVWMRTDSASYNVPTGTGTYGSSEAAALITSLGPTIETARLSTDGMSTAWLDHVGMLLLHGGADDGALTATQSADLESWVDNGGSLFYVGYHSSTANCDMVDSLPATWGIQCDRTLTGSAWSGSVTSITSHAVTSGVSSAQGLGGEHWTITTPAQTVASRTSGTPFVIVVEPGNGRVVAVADEWFLYNSGTGSADIGVASHRTLVDNIWVWLNDLPL